MRKIALGILAGLIAIIAAIILYNASWFEGPDSDGHIKLLAHRGVHQTFNHANLESDTCTATLINPPSHDFIENTLPSMQAAFEAGAEVVELDVHLTPDKQFAVIHDWTLDCRTDGKGVTQDTPMTTLKTLDIGYGYTADGGKTYPLRGKGVGLMPTLEDVLGRFPDKHFLVNFKSRRTDEGEALAALVAAHPEWRNAVWAAYGGAEPTFKSIQLIDGLKGYTGKSITNCAMDYEFMGWTGIIPESCKHTIVLVPANMGWAVWGWPYKFTRRMASVGTTVILVGPYSSGDFGTRGIDSIDEIKYVPKGFSGYVWTNRIELIGPELKRQGR